MPPAAFGRRWVLVAVAVAAVGGALLANRPPRAGTPAPAPGPVTATRAGDFLNSIGTQSAISQRGEKFAMTIRSVQYLGVRWLRTEGDIPILAYEELHRQTGVSFALALGSGGADIEGLLARGRRIHALGALLAFEGPNEPNTWTVTYKGKVGGGAGSWMPVARLMRDLYQAVKREPVLQKYPVWSTSQTGAQNDNVGLQFLKIPAGAKTNMPDGTQYADYANVHNYTYHPNAPGLADNKTWNAADPGSECKIDGLYGQNGVTWAKGFQGYSEADLQTLPRVTTETGPLIEGDVTEDVHALNLLSLYLAQYKRGWSYTANYLLRDRVDESGNQKFGFFAPDYTPRKAAHYLHNFTSILNDKGALATPESLNYTIADPPETLHDLLLQKSDRSFALVIWNERVKGSDTVDVDLGETFASVKVYDPTVGKSPVAEHGPTRVLKLTFTDHPLILVLPPR